MNKKAKNQIDTLTDNDKDILDRLLLRYISKLYSLIEKHPNPRNYARKILRKSDSDSTLALCYALLFVKDRSAVFTPTDLNKKLAEDFPSNLRNSSSVRALTMTEDMVNENHVKLLHPRHLRERVLEQLERDQIISNLKDEDLAIANAAPGKKTAEGVGIYDRGGRHSFYKTNPDIEKDKRVMSKPQAVDYLYEKLLKSDVAVKITKYQILAFLHLVKMTSEKGTIRLLNIGASNEHLKLTPQNIGALKNLSQLLQKLDDKGLEKLADVISNFLVQEKEQYKQFFSVVIFMKL